MRATERGAILSLVFIRVSVMDRVIVFIDGNNLYHCIKERGWRTWTDIGEVVKRVVGSNRTLVRVYYCNAPPPRGSEQEDRGKYYLDKVRGVPNIVFLESRLQSQQRLDEDGSSYWSYAEKGGDTALVVAMTKVALRDECDVAILISSDGDFLPGVQELKDAGKHVEVIYFRGRRPFILEGLATMREFRQSLLLEMDKPSKFTKRTGRKPSRHRRPQDREEGHLAYPEADIVTVPENPTPPAARSSSGS